MDDQDLAEVGAARGEFNGFLHVLRTQQLRRVPDAGGVFLSAGCSGRWYFDWVSENYAGTITRHLGVEAFSPEPADLPDNVSWLTDRLGAMSSVADASVDVVFAGQVVEHLWPSELAAFLIEVDRVLRPGGVFVLDSPNRPVSERLGWVQPEHTAEISATEARELLAIAGFDDIDIVGIWSCRSSDDAFSLPLDPSEDPDDTLDWQRRVADAAAHPDRAFVWWAQATKGARRPAAELLTSQVQRVHDQARSHALARANSIGVVDHIDDRRVARTEAGVAGHALFGPYVPMPAGSFTATFALERRHGDDAVVARDAVVAIVDVTTVTRTEPIAARTVTRADLDRVPPGGVLLVALPFEVDEMIFGFERRVFTSGAVALGVDLGRTHVDRAVVVADLDAPLVVDKAAEAQPTRTGPESRPLSVRADTRRLLESLRNAVVGRIRR